MIVDTEASMRFLRTAYERDDWIALFLKSYETGKTVQRVGPLSLFLEPRVHAWLRAMNAQRFNVYVSVNTIQPGRRTRTKDAIGTVRHIFLDADHDGPKVLDQIGIRDDLPPTSYVLESSPDRIHVFWRAEGFTPAGAARLQKHLARDLATDGAATSCSQTTRLPGYRNHKYSSPNLVTVRYQEAAARFSPGCFPRDSELRSTSMIVSDRRSTVPDLIERARRYLDRVAPAIAGQHGDLHTFQVCCRIVRGFDLDEGAAVAALRQWNDRCQPPWSDRDLQAKVRHALRYGREPFGRLLLTTNQTACRSGSTGRAER
ncbi:MAG: DNA-primase RepB domain-containing protein [Vicinamibacterales bacterium]